MKILYLRTVYWFNLTAGGSVSHTAGVINALDKKADVIVVSNDNLVGVKKKIKILKPILIPFIPKEINELLYNFKVIKYCRNIQADAIYQRYSGFSFGGVVIAKQKNIPIILEFNSSDVWKIKFWDFSNSKIKKFLKYLYNKIKLLIVKFIENYNLKHASYIVVVSKALKEYLLNKKIPSSKIIVNPNGVDTEKFNTNINCINVKKKYSLDGKVVFGFIGTFGQWHGAEKIVIAYGRLLKVFPEYKHKTILLMIGDGIKINEVKENIKKMGIKNNIILTGLIPIENVPEHLSACDVLINATIPNPDGSEFFGSPTKLFEYMAMGKAIICSNMAQMSEILEHMKTAYLVKPGDIEELMKAMKELIDNKSLRIKLGKNARNEVIAKYTWDRHVEIILRRING